MNVVHEKKLKNFFINVNYVVHIKQKKFCLSIIMKMVLLKRQKIGLKKSEIWTTLVYCKRMNAVHEKVYFKTLQIVVHIMIKGNVWVPIASHSNA